MNMPTTIFSFIFHFVKQQRAKFLFLMLSSIAWATNDTFFPYFLKRIVNTVQNYHGASYGIFTAVSGTLILIGLFWLVTEMVMRLQGITLIYTYPKFRASIRKKVFDYVKLHSHEYFVSHHAGDIAKKISDLPTSCQAIMEIMCFQFLPALTGIIIVLIMMWHIKGIFAGLLLLWMCLHLGLAFFSLKKGNRLWEKHSDTVSTLSGKIIDTFTNILNMRLFARGNYETDYLERFQQEELLKSKKALWFVELTRIGFGISGLFLIFGMIYLLLYGWTQHWITIGDFTQIGMQTFWLLGWVWFVSFQITIFAREMGTISNALSLVEKRHDIVDVNNAPALVISKGTICFDQVTFNYQRHRPVFESLNVTIPAGEKIGLVGFSGSGKSTFVNLILRFYDLKSGRILIDKQDISQVTQDSLRSQIAMIPQDPMLFHRSLMENIRYGRIDATDEEVIYASKLAHCHEFIEQADDGYNALVGERGVKLSGGQRQRIAIARAILKNAPILILDEATSSLDSITEKMIQESLNQVMQDRTTIVIAHRLSTLAEMDRILVFDKGEIIEEGTKESLLKTGGHFAMLWSKQIDGFLPEETEGN